MDANCINAIILANKYLPPKKLAHSLRVVQYALEDFDFCEYGNLTANDIFPVALLHDVVEDTECTFDDLKESGLSLYLIKCLKDLTKNPGENYLDYIQRCVGNGSSLSLLVKRADMKDHLLLEDTLTDKLKDKYLPAIPYLL